MAWLMMTNDDGIDSPYLQDLVDRLYELGHSIVVFAPKENNSAVSMKLTLGNPISFEKREDPRDNVHQFVIGGSPCDCVIAALDGGLQKELPGVIPKLVVSGINLGPNMSQDSYHSGTIAAAREAGMYGVPAIATSWSSFDPKGMEIAIDATVQLVTAALEILPDIPKNMSRKNVDLSPSHLSRWPENPAVPEWSEDPISALRNAFAGGETFLNLNVPTDWNGKFANTRLGMRWYRSAVSFTEDSSTFKLGAAEIVADVVHRGDVDANAEGYANVSCLPSWPQTHPLAVDDLLLAWALNQRVEGLPIFL